jgi:hypothetical protein
MSVARLCNYFEEEFVAIRMAVNALKEWHEFKCNGQLDA